MFRRTAGVDDEGWYTGLNQILEENLPDVPDLVWRDPCGAEGSGMDDPTSPLADWPEELSLELDFTDYISGIGEEVSPIIDHLLVASEEENVTSFLSPVKHEEQVVESEGKMSDRDQTCQMSDNYYLEESRTFSSKEEGIQEMRAFFDRATCRIQNDPGDGQIKCEFRLEMQVPPSDAGPGSHIQTGPCLLGDDDPDQQVEKLEFKPVSSPEPAKMKNACRKQGRPRMRAEDKKDRLYRCEECGKPFTKNSNLSRHRRTHKNNKFPCPLCQTEKRTKYIRKEYLKSHIKNKHKDLSMSEVNRILGSLK